MENILTLPFKKMTRDDITQVFHAGHEAWDLVENSTAFGKLYSTPLCAPENCLILWNTKALLTTDHQDLEHGYGVRMKGLETGLEYLYWHTLPLSPVWGGQTVRRGQIVAFMGNSGNVRVGGTYIPLEERLKDPELGTHLHLEVYKDGDRIDPMPLFNWSWQPDWGLVEYMQAMLVVLQKSIKVQT